MKNLPPCFPSQFTTRISYPSYNKLVCIQLSYSKTHTIRWTIVPFKPSQKESTFNMQQDEKKKKKRNRSLQNIFIKPPPLLLFQEDNLPYWITHFISHFLISSLSLPSLNYLLFIREGTQQYRHMKQQTTAQRTESTHTDLKLSLILRSQKLHVIYW